MEVHYGAVLSPPKENLDGLKSGMFEATLIAAAYNPGKTPLRTVHSLAFLAPNPIPDEFEWFNTVTEHPAMVKEMEQWNAIELFTVATYGYQLMSKKPIKTVADFKGMRIRALTAMGGPFKEFGASIEMMPGPDIYTALERGMLDAVLWVWPFTFGAYRLYELAPYATTGISAGKAGLSFHVNKDAWNALPKEWQDLAIWWADNRAMKSYLKWHAFDDAKWLPTFAKAGVQISTFPPEERAKLVAKAEPSWEAWVKDMEGKGLPGREILDLALKTKADIEAKKAEKK
jgi:TRAP-type C4-dicarboxylate transport system substrate-binding protein